MHSYLIQFQRNFQKNNNIELLDIDWGEKIGKWGMGWLSLGFGKIVAITHSGNLCDIPLLSYKKEIQPLWKQIAAAVSAVVLFPFSLLLAGVGCVGLAFSKSHAELAEKYKTSKLSRRSRIKKDKIDKIVDKKLKNEVNQVQNAPIEKQRIPEKVERTVFVSKSGLGGGVRATLKKTDWLNNINIYGYAAWYLQNNHYDVFLIPAQGHSIIHSVDSFIFEQNLPLREGICYFPNIPSGGRHNQHWGFVYVCRQTRVIEYYDPLANFGDKKTIDENLSKLAEKMDIKDPGRDGYQIKQYEISKKILEAIQKDGHSCGFWAIYLFILRMKHPETDFSKLDISHKVFDQHQSNVIDTLKKIDKEAGEKDETPPLYYY